MRILYCFLIFILFTQSCTCQESVQLYNAGIEFNEDSIWYGQTLISTYYGEREDAELHLYIYVPEGKGTMTLDYGFSIYDVLIGDIELNIDGEDKNFDEYFELKTYEDSFEIKSKNVKFTKPSSLTLKYSKNVGQDYSETINKKTTILDEVTFNLEEYQLYEEFVYRVPTLESGNLNLRIVNSALIHPNGYVQLVPVTQITEKDNFLEVTSTFWNEKEFTRLNVKTEYPVLKIGADPSETYALNMAFSYMYKDKKEVWVVLAFLSSFVALLAFYGGTIWGRKK